MNYNRLTYIHTDSGASYRVKAFMTNTPGLVVTQNGADFWRVTHEDSGLSIGGDIYNEEDALLFANALACLGIDFTQDKDSVEVQGRLLNVMNQLPAIAATYGA